MIDTILKMILVIICVALIFVIQLQAGKADGLSASITGSNKNLNLFNNSKARGSDLLLERLSVILVAAFFILILVLANT